MKIRTGFVSNSSTTSFCMYGAQCDIDLKTAFLMSLTKEEFENLENDFYNFDGFEEALENFEDREKFLEIIEDAEIDDIVEFLGEFYDMEIHFAYGGEYIGRGLNTMRDDETYGEFKESVKKKFEKFGITASPRFILEEYQS